MHDAVSTYKRYQVLKREQLYPWQAEFEDMLVLVYHGMHPAYINKKQKKSRKQRKRKT
jgi:hypothetical protein